MLSKDRVKLRPILREDLAKLNQWKNDEEIFMYLGGGFNPVSIDQQANWIDNLIEMTDYNKRFMIEADGKPIGMIGLYSINYINQNCEVGAYIGEKNLQGRGYGKIAYQLIEGYAREYLHQRKIKLFVVKDNDRAYKYWGKLGFEKKGVYEEERFIKGKFRDLIIMEKFI